MKEKLRQDKCCRTTLHNNGYTNITICNSKFGHR